MSKTFCMHPFTGLATREDGAIKVCCRSQPIAWIQETSIEDAWNCDSMKELRRKVMNDERPSECAACFMLEDQGVESLRQRHIKTDYPDNRATLFPDALDNLNEDYSMSESMSVIELKLNNLCNLKCRMCNPLDSTSWQDWDQVSEYYVRENNFLVPTIQRLVKKPGQYIGPFEDKEKWWDSFERIIPHLRRIEFAGGEPLMDPHHYKILDMLKPYGKNIDLKYATNGTTLGITKGRTIHEYWPSFKSIVVNLSIDGIHDVYNHIRSNGDFTLIEKNIREMKTIPNVKRIVGAFTTQAGNALQIADCAKYFIEKLGIYFYSHRVSYPKVLSAQVLPRALKIRAIENLMELRDDIDMIDGIDQLPMAREILLQQIKDNINYLNGHDQSSLWKDYLEFNYRLDSSRNSKSILEVVPEFKDYS
jgi:sulfatase maturation enzyme AslB (radical SAM superfamily)